MVIDTDVVIRFLTGDDSKKADRLGRFLASGKRAHLTDVTFAEIYWTLKSFYKFKKMKVVVALEALINTPSVDCNRQVLQQSLLILTENNTSFVDAYTAAWTQLNNDGKILSFDKGFDRLSGVVRVEP